MEESLTWMSGSSPIMTKRVDVRVKPDNDRGVGISVKRDSDRGVGISVKRDNDMWGVGGCCWWMKKGL